jgi:predicted peroxiredoxin
MKLGILITTDKNNDAVVGLTRAAVSKGHEVIIFCTDDAVNLVKDKSFTDLSTVGGVKMGYCDHSGKALGLSTDDVPDAITCGSQFDNATMFHDADKVVNL